MNIQAPVLIWTVLCFCILMLILNKFLFKPLLKIMDDRRSKIDGYNAAKQARLDEIEEKRLAAEIELENAKKEAAAALEKKLENERAKTDRDIAKARKDHETSLDELSVELQKESEAILGELEDKTEELALAYVAALLD